MHIGSIIIPMGVDHRRAVVLATGPGAELPSGVRQPTDVEPGDRVLFHRAHGEHVQGKVLIKELGGEMLLLKPADILVVYTGEVTVES